MSMAVYGDHLHVKSMLGRQCCYSEHISYTGDSTSPLTLFLLSSV